MNVREPSTSGTTRNQTVWPDAKPIGLMERFGAPFMRMPAVREAMPAGDFRDWPQIEAWAEGIAFEMESIRSAAPMFA